MILDIIEDYKKKTGKDNILTDFHMHTVFCDGKSTAEEMVLSAIEKGVDIMGFSGHSYTFFDESYCMTKNGTADYIKEVKRLKEKYADKIKILLGVEQDLYSLEKTDDYEYKIGSVHYFKFGDDYYPVDHNAQVIKEIADKYYGGDIISVCEKYYSQTEELVDMKPDIIGHFDLITKFNEKSALFDINDTRYIKAWKTAADKLIKLNVPFEINTGAISRGYRTTPYPDKQIADYLLNNGATLIWNSDSHHKDNICLKFFEDYD